MGDMGTSGKGTASLIYVFRETGQETGREDPPWPGLGEPSDVCPSPGLAAGTDRHFPFSEGTKEKAVSHGTLWEVLCLKFPAERVLWDTGASREEQVPRRAAEITRTMPGGAVDSAQPNRIPQPSHPFEACVQPQVTSTARGLTGATIWVYSVISTLGINGFLGSDQS